MRERERSEEEVFGKEQEEAAIMRLILSLMRIVYSFTGVGVHGATVTQPLCPGPR